MARKRFSTCSTSLLRVLAFNGTPEQLDDFEACDIKKASDIRDLFVPNFYFGCEADDPVNSWAFRTM